MPKSIKHTKVVPRCAKYNICDFKMCQLSSINLAYLELDVLRTIKLLNS